MCGRFAQLSPLSVIREVFNIRTVACDVTPNYNIAPMQEILVVICQNGNRLGKLHWGLVPSWVKDLSKASGWINARAETVDQKPGFREAFRRRRCLILADGFYEWQQKDRLKQPWYTTLPSGAPFVFAGIWETRKDSHEASYNSCAIITTQASESVCEIHNRMPVILLPETHAAWLDSENQDVEQLNKILLDGHVRKLKSYPVSKFVNSPKNNSPKCIEPVKNEEL